MTEPYKWSLREQVMIALIKEQGHNVSERQEGFSRKADVGWVCCTRCHTEWWVSRRVLMADGQLDATNDGVKWAEPARFTACIP